MLIHQAPRVIFHERQLAQLLPVRLSTERGEIQQPQARNCKAMQLWALQHEGPTAEAGLDDTEVGEGRSRGEQRSISRGELTPEYQSRQQREFACEFDLCSRVRHSESDCSRITLGACNT